MKPILLLACLFFGTCTFAQVAHLQVIKKGNVRKRIPQGTVIRIEDQAGNVLTGAFRIINDSNLLVGGHPVHIRDVRHVKLVRNKEKSPFNWEQFGYSTMGIVISTAGMSLSKWEPFNRAAAYSTVLGYSPFLLSTLRKMSLKKKQFKRSRQLGFRLWSIETYAPEKSNPAGF